MQIKLSDTLTGLGYTTSSFGLGVGAWLAQNWLAVLSAIGICCTIYFQFRHHRRQERRMGLLEDKTDGNHG